MADEKGKRIRIGSVSVQPDKKRVIIYIRVSTQEQATEGFSIDAQRSALLAYCKARGWDVVEVLVDPGFSGSNLERPGIQTLMSHIDSCDCVLVYKLDRLSRNLRDTLYLIEEVFLPHGVDFISMNESFDTHSAFGRAVLGILGVFAQLERETIKDRMAMGRIERFKEGKYSGSMAPIGYDYNSEAGQLVVNEYEAAQVRLVFQLYVGTPDAPGMGGRKIAEYMQSQGFKTKYGDYSHSRTVLSMLQNRAYLGEIRYRGEVIEHAHEPIIPVHVFEQAQLLRKTRDEKHKGATRSNSLLVGYVWCSCCGARCGCSKRGGEEHYYVCYSRLKVNPKMVKDPNCPSKSWRRADLEAVVDFEIRSLLFDKKYLHRLMERAAPVVEVDHQNEAIRKQISTLDKQIERIMDLYQTGTIPVELLNERVQKLYTEREGLQAMVSEEPSDTPAETQNESITRAYLDDVGEIWDKATTEQKREILSVLIDKIWICDDQTVRIDWAFL